MNDPLAFAWPVIYLLYTIAMTVWLRWMWQDTSYHRHPTRDRWIGTGLWLALMAGLGYLTGDLYGWW